MFSTIFKDQGKSQQLTTGLIAENITHFKTTIKDSWSTQTMREHQTLIHQVLLNSVWQSPKTNTNGKISWNLRQFENGNAHPISDILMGEEIWIYEFYHGINCQPAIQIFPDYTLHMKVKWPRSVGKKMPTSFFSTSVHMTATTLAHYNLPDLSDSETSRKAALLYSNKS
jgi:hypothetical protein